MKNFFRLILKAAPNVLLAVAFVNFLVSLFTALDRSNDIFLAIAASLNSGLMPFIAAAAIARFDQFLNSPRYMKQDDNNA